MLMLRRLLVILGTTGFWGLGPLGSVSCYCDPVQAAPPEKEAGRGFSFAVISDPQIRAPGHPWSRVFQQALGDLAAFEPRPAFVICTGDMLDGRSGRPLECPGELYQRQYRTLFAILEKHLPDDIPFYPVVGNHDYHRSADGSASGPELYARWWFPRIPPRARPRNSPYYSFDYGNVHFVVICTGLLGIARVKDYHDLVYGRQYRWLHQDLQQAARRREIDHILVFGHHNFHPVRSRGKSDWPGLRAIRDRIWQGLFVKYGVKAYFHGHWHFYDRDTPPGGVPYICLGGLDGLEQPRFAQLRVNHYAVVEVLKQRITVRVYRLGRKLYDQFELHDLAAGRVPPPQQTVRYRNRKQPAK